jgi:excinuclease ABC subunit C
MDLKEKAKALPSKPGVYLMKDSLENIIYIGKSKNLRNRVSQYFTSSDNLPPKIIEMVNNIKAFDYIITDTELDALLLECRLIKEIKPLYNRKLKNDNSYPYIKITVNEDYPRILIENIKKDDGSIYFGPYTSLSCVERVVDVIKENFPIRNCKSFYDRKNNSGCLNYHLGKCKGVCIGLLSKVEYLEGIKGILSLLEGKDEDIVNKLEYKMKEASAKLNFKLAAKYRDQLTGLKHALYRQRIIDILNRKERIIAFEIINDYLGKLFLFIGSRVVYEEIINIKALNAERLKEHIRSIMYKYFNKQDLDNIVFSKEEIDRAQILYSYLDNKKDIFYFKVTEKLMDKEMEQCINRRLEKLIKNIFIDDMKN